MPFSRVNVAKAVKGALSVAVLAYLAWYLGDNWRQLAALLRLTALELVAIYAASLAGMLVGPLVVQTLLRGMGTRTQFGDMFALDNAALLLNHLPLKFGSLFRARYLKHRYGFEYGRFAILVFYLNIITAMSSVGLSLAALILFYGVDTVEQKTLALVFAALFGGCFAAAVMPLPRPRSEHRIGRFLAKMLDARSSLARRPRVLVEAMALLTLRFVLTALRLALVYHATGVDLHPAGYLILGSIGFASLFVSITPGGLGVREIVLGFGVTALGVPFEQGMLTAMIDRAILLGWSFTVGLACTVLLAVKDPAALRRGADEANGG